MPLLITKGYNVNSNRSYWFFCIIFFLIGCNSGEFSVLEDHQLKKQNAEIEDNSMRRLLDQLTSPKFFEYTQAARKFLAMGAEAIPYLVENIHLMRESNDSVVPVCLNLLQILFQQQKEEWIFLQMQSIYPEIQKIAKEELARRKKREGKK